MADSDLIARLFPFDDNKGWAKTVIEELNPPRYVGPPPLTSSAPRISVGRHARQPTEPPEDGPHPHLELRFSRGPRTSLGFVLGKDPDTSDIVLVNEGGISDHHCAITFETEFNDTNNYRLVVRDLTSTYGTSVVYDREAGRDDGGVRRDFRWIVSGHPVPEQKKLIVVELHQNLKFQVVVSHHHIASELYIDNVNRFLQGSMSMDDLFGQLGLPSRQPTEPPSGARTPGIGTIYLKKKLGEGSFGVVTHIWDVSNGDEYAIKEPSTKAIRKKRVNENEWKKEAHIMGRVSHDHIIRFIGAKFTRVPQLIFEYVPEGALGDHNDISANEGVQILCQCLSALTYLHGQEPPIVHRDRYAGEISVKFGDFGLSRESRDPTTLCGSWQYVAPEIYNEVDRRKAHHKKRSYTLAVDIWSLGVTVFECVYDLPFQNTTGVTWCQEIVEKLTRDLQRNQDDLKQFLWDTMVIMAPELRQPAQYCHEQVLLIAGQDSNCSLTPTPASYA